jgi:hypothetical protein
LEKYKENSIKARGVEIAAKADVSRKQLDVDNSKLKHGEKITYIDPM